MTPWLWFGYVTATAAGLTLGAAMLGIVWLLSRVVLGWLQATETEVRQ